MNPRIVDYQILPAPVESRFEDFCLDFFQELWGDDDAQLIGKKGSGQNGVDICGQPNGGTDWFGAQCKNKEQLTDKKLTEGEVNAEIKKAKGFNPKLKSYVIITTATRNAAIQELARTISETHRGEGLFDVKIYAWEDVVKKLIDKTPKTLIKWYPYAAMPSTLAPELSEVKKAQIEVSESDFSNSNHVNVIGDNNVITINADKDKDEKDAVYNAQIDTAKLLLDTHNPEKALETLNKLKQTIWTQSGDIAKFRITTNIGFAYTQIGKPEEGARYFIEALQYNPTDEKALLNCATGFLLLNDSHSALEKIDEVLIKNPLSSRAISLKLEAAKDDVKLEDLISLIPSSLKDDGSVNEVVARLCMVRNRLVEAQSYLRQAISGSSEPETKARLAEVLLQQVLDDEVVVFGDHIGDVNRKRLEEAISLFDEIWSIVEATEMRKYRTNWVLNRSMAKRLLGDTSGSLSDIELVLKVNPAGTEGVRAKAGFLFDTNKKQEAVEWLESNDEALSKEPSLNFMLAGILRELKQVDKSIDLLKKLIEKPDGETKSHDAKRLLIQLYLDKKDYSEAQKILDLIPDTDEFIVLNLIEKSRIQTAQNQKDEALGSLQEAYSRINDETTHRQKLELANALYLNQQYQEASLLFEGLINGAEEDELTRKYLDSLYRASKYTEALDFAEKMRSEAGLTKFILQIETAIYDEIGDPNKSESLCREYLSLHPDDKDIKIRLGVVLLRLQKNAEIKPILSSITDTEGVDIAQFSQLINLYTEIGESEIALNLAYEFRRTFYSNPEAHLFYVNVFLNSEKHSEEHLDKREAVIDTYVELVNQQGQITPYLLEQRKNPDFRSGEITPANDIFTQIVGKKIGEKILINEHSGEELTVKDVKSKYVFAFQESIQKFNTHFPKAQGLVGYTFDSSTPETTEESIQTMLKQVSALADRIAPIEKAYRDGHITVGIFAELLKKSPIDIFYGIMSLPDTHVRAALGTKEEIESAVLHIRSYEQPKLILDITAIITIHELGLAEKLIAGYGKVGITQSTIDLLNESLSEKKGMKLKGFSTISKNDSGFVREEITPEQVEKSIKFFEGILSWIKISTDLVVAEKLSEKVFGSKKIEEVFGKSFADVISIVQKKDYILYSDDERLRSYCKGEYKLDGVWSQLVLSELVNKSLLSKEEYADAVIRLISLNFVHTSFNKDVLFRSGEQADWDVSKKPFSHILTLLGENYTNGTSSVMVATDFLISLWLDKKIEPQKKQNIINAVLKIIIEKRDLVNILGLLIALVIKNPLIDVRTKQEIKNYVTKFYFENGTIK